MSRRRGTKWHCDCVTCMAVEGGALDYTGSGKDGYYPKDFREHDCPLCLKYKEHGWDRGIVYEPMWTPPALQKFLGMRWICHSCLHSVHWVMERQLRACWGTAADAVIQLAVLMMLNSRLRSEASAEIMHTKWLHAALRTGRSIPQWLADEATERGIDVSHLPIIQIPEPEPPQEIEITIRPRVRPKIIDVAPTVSRHTIRPKDSATMDSSAV